MVSLYITVLDIGFANSVELKAEDSGTRRRSQNGCDLMAAFFN